MLGFVPRSVAVVGIAGVLVFAVPISAQAYLDPITTGEFVIGAVRAAAPVEAGAGVIGPEGTLLVTTAVAVGALAYATRDTWMPWIAGAFGAGGPATAAGTGSLYASLLWSAGTPSTLNGATVSVHWSSIALTNVNFVSSGQCKSSIGTVTPMAVLNGGLFTIHVGESADRVIGQCASDSVLSYAQTQLSGSHSNALSWGQSFDPKTGATYTVQSDCIKPDGSTGSITATTANPGLGGLMVPSCVAAFGPGSRASKFTVNGGQTGTTPHQLSTYPVPTDAQTAVLYPNCVGVGAIACTYVVDFQGTACTVGQAECVNWALRNLANPSDYSCLYGPYPVSIEACNIDERVYEPNGTRLTKLNTDGDPWTYDSPAPAGMPEVAPGTGTGTGTAPGPGTGTGTVPGGGTGTAPAPTGAPKTNGDCWAGGAFSWNPVDWVLRPVECALAWAFVPSAAAVSGPIADFKTTWNSKPPGSLIVGATTVFASIGNGWDGGCSGAASASFSRPEDGHPLQLPCTPSGGGSGTVPYTAMQIALIVATLIYLWHMVAAGISAQATGAGD